MPTYITLLRAFSVAEMEKILTKVVTRTRPTVDLSGGRACQIGQSPASCPDDDGA